MATQTSSGPATYLYDQTCDLLNTSQTAHPTDLAASMTKTLKNWKLLCPKYFFWRSRASNSKVYNGIWPELELVQALCLSCLPVPCRACLQVWWRSNQNFLHCKYGKIFQCSRASNLKSNSPIWLDIKLNQNFIPRFVTCNFDQDSCPLRGTGGHGFDSGPRHTEVVKNGTSCSSLGTQIYGVELGLVDPVSG